MNSCKKSQKHLVSSRLKEQREKPAEEQELLVDFTDEEGCGKYLDLHEVYTLYLNLKGVEPVDYLRFLVIFDQLFDISKEKKTQDYRKYLESLLEYLYDFISRAKPLLNLEQEMKNAISDFEEKWDKGSFPGWPKESGSALAHSGAHLDLSAFSSAEELMSLGLDRLKSALQALGLKCGGTLEERAQRLFMTKGIALESLDQSLFAKSRRKGKGNDISQKQKEIALLEAQVVVSSLLQICVLLSTCLF